MISVEDNCETEIITSAVLEPRSIYRKNTLSEKKFMRNSRKSRMHKRKMKEIVLAAKREAKQVTRDLQHHIQASKKEIEKVNGQVVKL